MPEKILNMIDDIYQQYLMHKISKENFEHKLANYLSSLPLKDKKTFTIAIVNERYKESFFGFRIFPEHDELDNITNDIVNNRISFRDLYKKWSSISNWYIEIDAAVFDRQQINFVPQELTAMTLHEIGHIIYSEKFVSVTYNCFKEAQGRMKISDKGNLKILYSLYMIPLSIACMQKYFVNTKNQIQVEYFADKALSKYGYTEHLANAIGKVVKAHGSQNQSDTSKSQNISSSINWCDMNVNDLVRRTDRLKDELYYQSLKSESRYFKALCFTLLNKIGFKMRERYTGSVVESTIDMMYEESKFGPNNLPALEYYTPIIDNAIFNKLASAADMMKRSSSLNTYEEALEGLFGSRNRAKKNIKLPNQHEVDEIEVEISRITNHQDKLYTLDLIYDLLDRIQLYEEYNPITIESKKESGKISTLRSELDRLRKAVLAKDVTKKEYKLFVKVPAGYEG